MKALSRTSLYVFIAISFLVSCTKPDVVNYESISMQTSDDALLQSEFPTCKLRRIVRNPTYKYDNRGNLGVLGWKSSWYDNKVSIYRSHPVFQFIFRNYSRNNAAVQSAYNSKGLPLSLYPSNDAFFNAYQSNPGSGYKGGIQKVIYDCQ